MCCGELSRDGGVPCEVDAVQAVSVQHVHAVHRGQQGAIGGLHRDVKAPVDVDVPLGVDGCQQRTGVRQVRSGCHRGNT